MAPQPITWTLFITFATLTILAAFLTVSAAQWWRLRGRNGRAIRRVAELMMVLAIVFNIFWLVRLHTIVPIIPAPMAYQLLQDWIWVLYLWLAIAVIRARPAP